jgi:hypothetical protein
VSPIVRSWLVARWTPVVGAVLLLLDDELQASRRSGNAGSAIPMVAALRMKSRRLSGHGG